MIDLIVVRGQADVTGPDVEDPLVTTVPVALARGRNELDSNSRLQPIRLTCFYRAGFRHGQIVRVMDALQGETWVGKITGLNHYVEDFTPLTELSVERPV